MKKILLYDNGSSFTLDSYKTHPLGGSETSIILLAKGLSLLGHSVILLSNTNQEERINNIFHTSTSRFTNYASSCDYLIFNRYLPKDVMEFVGEIPIYYYAHDAYDQSNVQWMMNQGSVDLLEKIFCVSEWQKQTFKNYLDVSTDKMIVLGNPIDLGLFIGNRKRDKTKLVYTSIPYKGLSLPKIINSLSIRFPKLDFHLDVYSSMELYGQKDQQQYQEFYSFLHNQPNITIKPLVSTKELAGVFAEASILLLPSDYHETHCMCCTQAQAAGCIPISVASGAMPERITHNKTGFLTDGPNIKNPNTFNQFISLIQKSLLKDDLNQIRTNCIASVLPLDNIRLARDLTRNL